MQSSRYVLGSEGLHEVKSVSSFHTDLSTINNQQIAEDNQSLGLIDNLNCSFLIDELKKIDGIDLDEFLNEESTKNALIECESEEEGFLGSCDQLKNSEAEKGSLLHDKDELAVISPDLIYNCNGFGQQLSMPPKVEIKTENINYEDFSSSQPTGITMKRELEDISPPKNAKKRKNSEMSSCSSSSLNLKNLPKEKQCVRVSDFCWGILEQDKDKAETDQRLSWLDRQKLIFKIQSKYKEDVARLWGLKKGNRNACYFNLSRSIRWAKVHNQDFEDVTDQDQVGVWLVFKFGPRFRNRMSSIL